MNKFSFVFSGMISVSMFVSEVFANQTASQKGENIKLLSHLETTSCLKSSACSGTLPAGTDNPLHELAPQDFTKGLVSGVYWRVEKIHKQDGINFTTLLNIVKREKSDEYLVYMMLRSGKRQGVTARFTTRDIFNFPERMIVDDPIKTEKGTIQGRFVVRPFVQLPKE